MKFSKKEKLLKRRFYFCKKQLPVSKNCKFYLPNKKNSACTKHRYRIYIFFKCRMEYLVGEFHLINDTFKYRWPFTKECLVKGTHTIRMIRALLNFRAIISWEERLFRATLLMLLWHSIYRFYFSKIMSHVQFRQTECLFLNLKDPEMVIKKDSRREKARFQLLIILRFFQFDKFIFYYRTIFSHFFFA